MDERPRGRRPSRPWLDHESATTPVLPSVPEPGPGAGLSGASKSGAGNSGTRGSAARARQAPAARARQAPAGARRGAAAGTPRASRSATSALLTAKIALTLVSALVLGVAGYSWATVQGVVHGFTVADVIGDQGGGDAPADGSRDILLVGTDSRTDAQGNPLPNEVLQELDVGDDDGQMNTDTLILLHIPNDGSEAVGVSIPRDSYVDVPGFGQHKINSAFARGREAAERRLEQRETRDRDEIERLADEEGARTLIATVEELTGRTIDNYASVNLFGFVEITEAVGGVDVCLNEPVEEPRSGADFDAGVQTISGKDALAFVRQRHGLPRGDLDRVVRQQVFMAGLADNVLSAGTLSNPAQLDSFLDAVSRSVVLDQDWNIVEFADQVSGLTGGEIEFRTIPVQSLNIDTPEGSAVQVDPAAIREFFEEHSDLDDDPEPDEQADADEERNAEITVNVLNTTSTADLAADVAEALSEQGFTEGMIDNAPERAITAVRHPPGAGEDAERVLDALDGDGAVQPDSEVDDGEITILLGTDNSDPSGSANPGGDTAQAPDQQAPDQQELDQQEPGDEPPGEPDPGVEQDEPITADGVTCVN